MKMSKKQRNELIIFLFKTGEVLDHNLQIHFKPFRICALFMTLMNSLFPVFPLSIAFLCTLRSFRSLFAYSHSTFQFFHSERSFPNFILTIKQLLPLDGSPKRCVLENPSPRVASSDFHLVRKNSLALHYMTVIISIV